MIIQFSEDSKQNKAKAQQKYQKSLVLDKYFKMTKFLIIGLIVPNENFCSNLAFRVSVSSSVWIFSILSLYISKGSGKKNLFNNQELLQLLIISLIPIT